MRHGDVLLKVLLELFQKLVGAAAIGGRPPQRAKLPYPSKAPQKGECRASARQRGGPLAVGVLRLRSEEPHKWGVPLILKIDRTSV